MTQDPKYTNVTRLLPIIIKVNISNPQSHLLTTGGLSKLNQSLEGPAVSQYHGPVELNTTTALMEVNLYRFFLFFEHLEHTQ